MADEILKNTLPSLAPELTGNRSADIKTLESSVGKTEQFSSVMRGISQGAYGGRQARDTATMQRQIDPTKVSGGTFSDIIGFMERERGGDISKIYGSTMEAHTASQREKSQLASELRAEERQEKSGFEAVFGYMPGEMGSKEKKMLQDYYKSERDYEKSKRSMDLESSSLALQKQRQLLAEGGKEKLSQSLTNYKNQLGEIVRDREGDGYTNPYLYKQLRSKFTSAGGNSDDFDSYIGNFVNPADHKNVFGPRMMKKSEDVWNTGGSAVAGKWDEIADIYKP